MSDEPQIEGPEIRALQVAGNDTGLTPLYAAMRWDTDAQAKRAWEQANRSAKNVSVWRTRTPANPPHTDHVCIVLGEDRERVVHAIAVLSREPGWSAYRIDTDLASALAARRYRTALDNPAGAKVVSHGARLLDKQGRLHPYKGKTADD
jgi:hypothetical protein